MKFKLIIISVFVGLSALSFATPTNYTDISETIVQSAFDEGFEDGYCEGWKDVKGEFSICPITPIAPIPKIGQSSNSYRDGYNTGFKRGMKDANED